MVLCKVFSVYIIYYILFIYKNYSLINYRYLKKCVLFYIKYSLLIMKKIKTVKKKRRHFKQLHKL